VLKLKSKVKIGFVIVLSIFFLSFPLPLAAEETLAEQKLAPQKPKISYLTESIGKCKVDWEKGVITVTATGSSPKPDEDTPLASLYPQAKVAAIAEARKELLEAVKGVKVDSKTIVKNLCLKDEIVVTRVSGFIKGTKLVGEPVYEVYQDGSVACTITMQLSLTGYNGLINYVLPGPVYELPKPVKKKSQKTLVVTQKPQKMTIYTGLIVDALELDARPCMSPKILNEEGKEVYGSAFVKKEFAIKFGMAGYSNSIEKALKITDRIGNNPVLVKGLKAVGPQKTDIVISNKDASKLEELKKDLSFLQNCRVIIVID
jgi:hypothetical protein